MIKTKTKKIQFSLGIIFLLVFLGVSGVYASSSENVSGWLWGGSQDAAGNPTFGWISTNNTNVSGTTAYGLNVPNSGNVTGYAWSENVGWIDFEPQNHCTTGVADAVHYKALSCTNASGNTGGITKSGSVLTGWARIVSIAQATATGNAGGYDGWIKFSQGGNYSSGVTLSGNTLSGHAWSGDLGWINFSSAFVSCTPNYTSYSCTLQTVATCGVCGTPVITQQAVCSRVDTNGCVGDPLPSVGDCEANGVTCPSDVVVDPCACDNPINMWREVAP